MLTEPLLARLRLESMAVDRTVQRALDEARSQKIADDFNVEAMGVLHISARRDGSHHVVDGQHRRDAALKAGVDPSTEVPCLVYEGLTLAEEATLFRRLNATRGVNAVDRFRIRVVEGDPTAVQLSRMLTEYGWQVVTGKKTAQFAAVAALESIYKGADIYDGEHFEECETVVRVITEAWGHNPNGVRGEVVSGLGIFLLRNGHSVDLHKLATEIGKKEGAPLSLLADAKALKQISGGNTANAMAEILTNLHNKGRRTNRVPDWRRTTRKIQAVA